MLPFTLILCFSSFVCQKKKSLLLNFSNISGGCVFNVSSGKINLGKYILILNFKNVSLRYENQENKSRDNFKGDRDLFWESEVQVLFLLINTFNNSIPILFQLFICLIFFYVYLFIWLQWVIVVAYELLAEACGIQFPDQGLNLGPLHWKHGLLATELPGKSLSYVINSIYSEKIQYLSSSL